MVIESFPPVSSADPQGLVAVGGDLEIPSLKLAYSQGIFPWPIKENFPLTWFSPDPRGILIQKDLYLSRSVKKTLRQKPFHYSLNCEFSQVISYCAKIKRKNQGDTWITHYLEKAFLDFHQAGYAFSLEVWEKDRLVGGVYGVHFGHFVAGESMFHLETGASKAALIELMKLLKSWGIEWIDTQMTTPLLRSFGGKEIPRSRYLRMLKKSLKNPPLLPLREKIRWN